MAPEFGGRVDTLDRVAKRADDFEWWNMRGDSLRSFGEAEIWIDLADRAHAVGVAEVIRVPGQPLRIIGGEEVGLLDSLGQIDMPDEDFVQPGGAGAARSDPDEIGESEFHLAV